MQEVNFLVSDITELEDGSGWKVTFTGMDGKPAAVVKCKRKINDYLELRECIFVIGQVVRATEVLHEH